MIQGQYQSNTKILQKKMQIIFRFLDLTDSWFHKLAYKKDRADMRSKELAYWNTEMVQLQELHVFRRSAACWYCPQRKGSSLEAHDEPISVTTFLKTPASGKHVEDMVSR